MNRASGKISQNIIDDVKHATDVVELISQYVGLKQRGRNFLGLCPFHNEKTPSFTVSPDKQIFYCFGCQAGGDVFSFVRQYEKISYPESIRMLAERVNIVIPQTQSRTDEPPSETEAIHFALKLAEQFYFEKLSTSTVAKAYLTGRGFDQKTIDTFRIGYSPDGWSEFLDFAKSKSVDLGILERAGLILPKSGGGGYYDRFRQRLMFPIHNPSGRVIGFGGRQLREEENSPKYMNSPEGPVYHKSKTLYGLHQSKETIRRADQIVLVEGYADCVSLHQFGITNVVASSGTALTGDQAQLIKRYTQNVILIYDGDSAGIHAAERGGGILLEAGLNVKIVTLPGQHDPDSIIRAEGPEAFADMLLHGLAYVDFRIVQWREQNKLDTVNGKTAAIRELIEVFARTKDPIRQSLFVQEISEKLKIDKGIVAQELKKLTRGDKSLPAEKPAPLVDFAIVEKNLPERILRAERALLRALLGNSPSVSDKIFIHLRPENFQNASIRKLVEQIHEEFMQDQQCNIDALKETLDESVQKAVNRLLMEDRDIFDAEDCIAAIQIYNLEGKMNELRETMREMEQEKEDIAQLYDAYMTVQKQIQNIKKSKQLLTVEDKSVQERIPF